MPRTPALARAVALATTLASTLALLAAGCNESPSAASRNTLADASAAFTTVPLGYGQVTSSYAGESDGAPSMWLPGKRGDHFDRGTMMGGGIGDPFVGGVGRGHGFGHEGPFGGPFGGGLRGLTCAGSFSASTGRFTCDTETRDGLTITRSARYTDASGQVQQAFDTATTNTVNVQTAVSGTVTFSRDSAAGDTTRHHGRGPRHVGHIAGDTTTILSATTTVQHVSDRTVSGLATGSTQRTVEGTSGGTETSTGTSSQGDFTSTRTAADTTVGLVIPLEDGRPTYPTAGTVIRVMQASITYAGQSPIASSRREVVTYDGSSTATVTITQDGTTKTCTLPLPRGRMSCD